MAFIPLLPYWLLFLGGFSLSSVHSLNCTSQSLKINKLYNNCTDLPSLSSYLHWTYDSSKSSLSIAFLAPPAKSNGWIAWAINPTGTGMVGAQALIAFKKSDGSLTVKTYNLSSYASIVQSKLSFKVSDSSAEYSGGLMKIFATLALPENMTTVNQVWQVGSSVVDDMPVKHAFEQPNLNAKGTLELVKAQSNVTTGGAAGGGGGTVNSTITGKQNNNNSRIRGSKVGLYVFLFLIGNLAC